LFRLIPNAQLAVFPGADHFLLWQNPEKMLPQIAAFLDAAVPESKNPQEK
jgi:pimeloyl-ACP methyl ester carboxylesterase